MIFQVVLKRRSISRSQSKLAEKLYKKLWMAIIVFHGSSSIGSITHNQPSDFAKPGTFAFTVKNAPHHIPKVDKLSGCDCQELTDLYRCKTDVCDFCECSHRSRTIRSIILKCYSARLVNRSLNIKISRVHSSITCTKNASHKRL